jgi:hypothetical protein
MPLSIEMLWSFFPKGKFVFKPESIKSIQKLAYSARYWIDLFKFTPITYNKCKVLDKP